MKLSFALFFLLTMCCVAGFAQSKQPSANAVLKEATAQAARDNKKVFLLFHASWCGWCHRMDSLMNAPTCKKLFTDHFVIRHLTVMESDKYKHLENPGGEALLEKYQGKGQGIPYWLIFDKEGKLLADCLKRPDGAGLDQPGENVGCPATPEEVAYFINVLRQTTTLKSDQLATIEKSFIKK